MPLLIRDRSFMAGGGTEEKCFLRKNLLIQQSD